MDTIAAQTLYDIRDMSAFTSGRELHSFFAQELGEPSPSGYVRIDAERALAWAIAQEQIQLGQMGWPSATEAEATWAIIELLLATIKIARKPGQ